MASGKIYVLQSGDTFYYKIGLTSGSVKKRIAELQTGNPFRITARLVHPVQNMKIAEDILHRRYFQKRGLGEWFYFGPSFLYDPDDIFIEHVIDYITHTLNQEVEHRLLLKDMNTDGN